MSTGHVFQKVCETSWCIREKCGTCLENHKLASVLPTILQVFKRILQRQITNYAVILLSQYLGGFKKGFTTQSVLIISWKMKKVFSGVCLGDT